jgi:hypothetical protein
MKNKYYVNRQAQMNGDHEVHIEGCVWMPKRENPIFLGEFASCQEAVHAAKSHFSQVNGCYYCCNPCHTQ